MPAPHERPRYRRVADELRHRIMSGAIPAGSILPSETTIMAEFGVARGTAREAIALLRSEGLAITEMGRGTFARPVLPIRRLGSERYRRELEQIRGDLPPETSFTVDQGVRWNDYRLDKAFHEVPAGVATADLFGVPAGTMLLERRFVFYTDGVAQQMSTSYYLLAMVAGTPVADPDREPWPGGNTAQMYSLGVTITGIRERVRSRMPVANEVETLHIPGGTPVVTIARQTYAEDQVVEVADIVIPADRVELGYWIDLT
ncbi:GntR family transcriptional regulator [Micromonospora pisi]|uniref:GntR family transcriptional regulator n=1 Tax=Micromonospora pisi TaxID=589240 RepID=UPI001B87AA15|nr:GntR family transcriptional regulator [Micromonospora pisi]